MSDLPCSISPTCCLYRLSARLTIATVAAIGTAMALGWTWYHVIVWGPGPVQSLNVLLDSGVMTQMLIVIAIVASHILGTLCHEAGHIVIAVITRQHPSVWMGSRFAIVDGGITLNGQLARRVRISLELLGGILFHFGAIALLAVVCVVIGGTLFEAMPTINFVLLVLSFAGDLQPKGDLARMIAVWRD